MKMNVCECVCVCVCVCVLDDSLVGRLQSITHTHSIEKVASTCYLGHVHTIHCLQCTFYLALLSCEIAERKVFNTQLSANMPGFRSQTKQSFQTSWCYAKHCKYFNPIQDMLFKKRFYLFWRVAESLTFQFFPRYEVMKFSVIQPKKLPHLINNF